MKPASGCPLSSARGRHQRHHVLPAGLHALRRYPPGVALDLVAVRRHDHAGARCGEDQVLQRAGVIAWPGTEQLQELGEVGEGHGREVLHPLELLRLGEQLRQVAAPACRVLGVALFVGGGGIEHGFDALADASGRLGLL